MKHIIKEKVAKPLKVAENITKRLLKPLESKTCLHDKEDYLLNEIHEHEDSVDADGTCLVCGETNLI